MNTIPTLPCGLPVEVYATRIGPDQIALQSPIETDVYPVPDGLRTLILHPGNVIARWEDAPLEAIGFVVLAADTRSYELVQDLSAALDMAAGNGGTVYPLMNVTIDPEVTPTLHVLPDAEEALWVDIGDRLVSIATDGDTLLVDVLTDSGELKARCSTTLFN